MTRYRVVCQGTGSKAGYAFVTAADDSYRTWFPATEAVARALELNRTALMADLAEYRWQQETGGVQIEDTVIATGREDQAMLTGVLALAGLAPDRQIDWKGPKGWVSVDAAALSERARVVGDHVQTCFSIERAVAARIAALDTLEAMLAFDISIAWQEAINEQ